MDQVVAQALTLCTKLMNVRRKDLLSMQVEGTA
jgi:UDP-galactopyranose mutase